MLKTSIKHNSLHSQVKRREEIEAQEQENLLGARNVEQERIQVSLLT